MKSLSLLTLAVLSLCLPMNAQTPTPGPALPAEKYEFSTNRSATMEYLYYLPKDHAAGGDKKWPLVLFLHGAGERGSEVQRVGVHGPMRLVREGKNFPFVIVAPQCPTGKQWENESLLGLLDHVTKKYSVDTNRIYLTGLSMGGYGTWRLGLARPEKFAALVPICGGANMIDALLGRRDALKYLPIWAFHGAKDPVVPLEESERVVNGLKKMGAQEVKLTVYPEAQHDSWTEAYNTPALYEWLLAHSLTDTNRVSK